MTMSQEAFNELLSELRAISDIRGALGLLLWDKRTYMPEKGTAVRSERIATLVGLATERATSETIGRLLEDAAPWVDQLPDGAFERGLHRVASRSYRKSKAIPIELQVEMSRTSNAAYLSWVKARKAADFSLFRDDLARIIELQKQAVDCLRPLFPDASEDYDILLDDYEEGLKTAEVTRVFDQLKAATPALLKRVTGTDGWETREAAVHGHFPAATQEALVRDVLKTVGFTDDAFNLAETTHPFESSMSINDVRITTKYEEDFFNPCIFGCLHEFGHGLYEHQINPDYDRTPVARGVSMAWHESQSRMLENFVGRGRPFWSWATPKVQAAFPDAFGAMSADDMYRAVNAMGPSLIRIEADELTYNLHIILRFELERDLFGGSLTIDDLPEAWNAKVKAYLGLDVSDASQGVLQDVHWSQGSFGYFPTYALGNVVAAMLWQRMQAEMPGMEEEFARGEFGSYRQWLQEHIHTFGSMYSPNDLRQKVFGAPGLDAQPLIDYLTAKVGELY